MNHHQVNSHLITFKRASHATSRDDNFIGMNCYFLYNDKYQIKMLWLRVFVTVLDWLYTCISKRRFWAILQVKHLWYLVQSALKMKSKLNFIVINETAKKWTTKVCFHVWSYGNFCLLDLCLHNQIVQDGISSSVNKCERWKCLHENGTKKMYKPTSVTKIFLKFEMLWVKTFTNSKSKHRQDIPDLHYTKNHSLLNLLFSIQTGHNRPEVHDLKNNSAA